MSASHADPRIFVDTSAYYAAVDGRDASHAVVAVTMRQLLAEPRKFFTTNAVLFELHGLLLNRLGRRVALEAIGELRASQTIVRVRERDELRAEDILAHFQDKNVSLTDALSFAVMERLGF
jgi:predicted nucleic acid-binding protein